MSDFLVVAQSEVTGSLEEENVLQFSFDYTKVGRIDSQLKEIDLQVKDFRTVLFCSLNCAQTITRNANTFPNLRKGLILNKEFLHWNFYSSLIDKKLLLNRSYMILPFHKVFEAKEIIQKCFGDHIFIRPNSPMKPFTGVDIHYDDLEEELYIMSLANSISRHELCAVAPYKKLPECEYRVWIVDSVPVTSASYSWNKEAEKKETPQRVLDVAKQIASNLQYNEDTFVADFVEYNNEVKLVELNALSCSGFYEGMDKQKLFNALDDIMI